MEQYIPRMKKQYRESVIAALSKEFGYTSPMEIPTIEKISVSVGVGEAIENKKLLDSAVSELELITGQHAVKTKARKSIANFKVRQGQEIGTMVTLRGYQMWEFFDRLVNVALPRVKDFRGVNPNAFDGHGNYSLGIKEQIIFPEIDYDKIERVSGLNIAIVTTAKTDEEGHSLLAKLGMPFSK
jgi:large subunit ribosomal protein L5